MKKDWLENKLDELIAKAKRTGYFQNVIDDALHFEANDGYAWDVALAIALEYWAQ